MIIKDKELVIIMKHLYDQYFDFKDIKINDIDIVIDKFIKIKANLNYCNVDTNVDAVVRVRLIDDNIVINTKGIIKYGFINLDFNKVIKEYLKDEKYIKIIQVKDDDILVKNNYLGSLVCNNGLLEIILK